MVRRLADGSRPRSPLPLPVRPLRHPGARSHHPHPRAGARGPRRVGLAGRRVDRAVRPGRGRAEVDGQRQPALLGRPPARSGHHGAHFAERHGQRRSLGGASAGRSHRRRTLFRLHQPPGAGPDRNHPRGVCPDGRRRRRGQSGGRPLRQSLHLRRSGLSGRGLAGGRALEETLLEHPFQWSGDRRRRPDHRPYPGGSAAERTGIPADEGGPGRGRRPRLRLRRRPYQAPVRGDGRHGGLSPVQPH